MVRKPDGTASNLLGRLLDFVQTQLTDSARRAKSARTLVSGILTSNIQGVIAKYPAHQREVATWSETDFERFRADLEVFLRGLAGFQTRGGAIVQPIEFSHISLYPMPQRQRSALAPLLVEGATRDVLWFQIVNLVRFAGGERLRVCLADDCDRMFVKVGKREFCSDRCQGRVNSRRVRERDRKEGR